MADSYWWMNGTTTTTTTDTTFMYDPSTSDYTVVMDDDYRRVFAWPQGELGQLGGIQFTKTEDVVTMKRVDPFLMVWFVDGEPILVMEKDGTLRVVEEEDGEH